MRKPRQQHTISSHRCAVKSYHVDRPLRLKVLQEYANRTEREIDEYISRK